MCLLGAAWMGEELCIWVVSRIMEVECGLTRGRKEEQRRRVRRWF